MRLLGIILTLIILSGIGGLLYLAYLGMVYIGWQWTVLTVFLLFCFFGLFLAWKVQQGQGVK